MTEPEWLTSGDPAAMLKLLKDSKAFNNPEGWASDRKLRLFACACRRTAGYYDWPADGWGHMEDYPEDEIMANNSPHGPAIPAIEHAMLFVSEHRPVSLDSPLTMPIAAALLREIIGNPYRQPVYDRCCGLRNHGAVIRIASIIYEGRRWEDMPILADALEDAGCHDAEILNHLRGPGPHVRGCWTIDLLLGNS